MQKTLLDSTRNGIGGLSAVVPCAKICSLLDALGKILKSEPTVKEVHLLQLEPQGCVAGLQADSEDSMARLTPLNIQSSVN